MLCLMDRADKVLDSRLEIHYRLSLTTEMIMDIMAFFGIFHNFLRSVSLYSCMTFPPRHSLLFHPGLKTTMPQRDANNHTALCLPLCQQFSYDPLYQAQQQETLAINEL